MKKKGFTLIELLAVIVILAVIALIATPTILGVIEKSKKGAAENSALGYIDAIEKQIALNMLELDTSSIDDGTYGILDIELSYKGNTPDSGTYVIEKGIVSKAILEFKNYYVCYSDNKTTISKDNSELIECSDIDSTTVYQEAILNGAYPVLSNGLIPVTIDDDGTVHKANINKKWYSYKNKVWANAVILKSNTEYEDNQVIPEDDIDSYFVWIPRYKYKIFNTGDYTGTISEVPTSSNAQTIEIVFESKETSISTGTQVGDYLTHPAFTSFDVNGIWVGKFETSGTSVEESDGTTTYDIDVKPNVTSLTNQTVLTFFTLGYNYNRALDSHMMKNTEWGAVAYLSHSIYGINKEININNSSGMITGSSALPSTNQQTFPGDYGSDSSYYSAYNTEIGYLASTTGNISGVYDMSGGAWEYMAAYMSGQMGSSGFQETTIANYNSKYFDVYNAESTNASYSYRILGDATGEMGPFYYYSESDGLKRRHNSWYADYSIFVNSNYPWFFQGGLYDYGALAGPFGFEIFTGVENSNATFRLVLAF
jgi:prepilin-type N-terminal cleavage/methylation domain-containing protein